MLHPSLSFCQCRPDWLVLNFTAYLMTLLIWQQKVHFQQQNEKPTDVIKKDVLITQQPNTGILSKYGQDIPQDLLQLPELLTQATSMPEEAPPNEVGTNLPPNSTPA